MTTTLVAATLNEIEGVNAVLPKIAREAADEIIVIDGGSTDGTIEWCEEHGFRVLRQKTKGYGNAYKEAIAEARGDIIVEFQPDGNSLPEKIPELVAAIHKGYDMIIGSRYLPGAKSEDDDRVTALGNHFFTGLVNLFFGTDITDALIGFRAFRKDAYQSVQIRAQGLAWCIELPIKFAKKGYRITEIPADEPKRIGGMRKMRPLRTGLQVLGVFIRELLTS